MSIGDWTDKEWDVPTTLYYLVQTAEPVSDRAEAAMSGTEIHWDAAHVEIGKLMWALKQAKETLRRDALGRPT